MWGQPAAGIGSLAALHVVVFVVDQCAACSAASDIKMLGLLRPEPSRAEPNSNRAIVINCATEFGSNFARKLRVAMRRQIRFGCSTQATVRSGLPLCPSVLNPIPETSSGAEEGARSLRLLQASSAASTRARSTFNKQF